MTQRHVGLKTGIAQTWIRPWEEGSTAPNDRQKATQAVAAPLKY
jgi:hypothetical protein